jgi:hypothetical protein
MVEPSKTRIFGVRSSCSYAKKILVQITIVTKVSVRKMNITAEGPHFDPDDDDAVVYNDSSTIFLPNATLMTPVGHPTMSVFDAVVEAVKNASRVHGCSTEVRVWDWDLSAVTYVGVRAPTHVRQLPARSLVKIAVFAVVSMFAVVGNVAVVGLVLKNRSLRNTLNYYLVNLAVADVVIATFCAWTFLIDNVTNSPWVLGPVVCKLSGFAQSTPKYTYF